MTSALIAELRAAFDDRCVTAESTRVEHAIDVSRHAPGLPDAVVYPVTTEEVSRIVAGCNRHGVPVVPFGTGTAVEGGVVAVRGGVCIDLTRMNQIVRVSAVDMDATVQAGVTRYQLNDHLAALHESDRSAPELHFPIDPGADASLGGMAATCASGSAAVRYGTMRGSMLGLTVVLADGKVVKTGGRARKSSAGYHLTGLFVGSEGTLGVITELTLRLQRVPEAIASAVCPFGDVDSAIAAAIEVLTAGIPVARMEFLDEVLIAAVNEYSGLRNEVTPTLFFEFHGTEDFVAECSRRTGEITSKRGGGEFRWATDRPERDRLWQARYDSYYACLALRPNSVGYVTDVCVPISNLAECLRRAKRYAAESRLPAPVFGHVGDGNFHVVIVIDKDSEDDLAEAQQIGRRIVDDALELDGTCTGEHGIGLGKRDILRQECGDAVDVMRQIKAALDPMNIMNPGKVLPDSPAM
ncbi:MAG: FAD-binding protein [Planctomycetota bacterium]|nr:MAG: FAD-binding protein [Planctomycetota bacterium]REJ91258.1 MAG: FAD-binding protein [Planctomycetota bacterium]REK28878.1 MAG: FAD-binding protein [Planctomycetota bacterium]REK39688.1 MAG: FAD-binding protein [Planctomycetota bacterium]